MSSAKRKRSVSPAQRQTGSGKQDPLLEERIPATYERSKIPTRNVYSVIRLLEARKTQQAIQEFMRIYAESALSSKQNQFSLTKSLFAAVTPVDPLFRARWNEVREALRGKKGFEQADTTINDPANKALNLKLYDNAVRRTAEAVKTFDAEILAAIAALTPPYPALQNFRFPKETLGALVAERKQKRVAKGKDEDDVSNWAWNVEQPQTLYDLVRTTADNATGMLLFCSLLVLSGRRQSALILSSFSAVPGKPTWCNIRNDVKGRGLEKADYQFPLLCDCAFFLRKLQEWRDWAVSELNGGKALSAPSAQKFNPHVNRVAKEWIGDVPALRAAAADNEIKAHSFRRLYLAFLLYAYKSYPLSFSFFAFTALGHTSPSQGATQVYMPATTVVLIVMR